ncbi:MAG: heterodisulfide reductase [Rhodospirillales bacterium]|jgi:quinone-modifying oxidoreductase, subunit QmoC|nr:heterodisulfide reductase [Rhodospirillales bacterium]
MTAHLPESKRKYDLTFARWVSRNVHGGDKLNMCMQCGVCSGSCPLGEQMDYGPRRLFMMVRAGMKDEVLKSDTIWNCVSCYRSEVRCPRGVPVTHILDALSVVAVRAGYAEAKTAETTRFAKAFWWSAKKFGLTDERLVTAIYYFSGGLVDGIRKGWANQKIALRMIGKKRMHVGMPKKIKRRAELQKILAKAVEIEARNGAGDTS